MKLFENKVGRPSNEVLEKRKRFKIIVAIAVLLLISGVTVLTMKFLGSREGTNKSASSPISFSLAGDGVGIDVDNKYYTSGNYVNIINTGAKTATSKFITTNYNAATASVKVKLTTTLSDLYNGKTCPPYKDKIYSYFKVTTYDKNNKAIKTTIASITGKTATNKVTITETTHHIVIEVIKKDCTKETPVSSAGTAVTISTVPKIEPVATDKNGNVKKDIKQISYDKNSNIRVYQVNNKGQYYSAFKVTNNSGFTYYYRWFTFKGADRSWKEISYDGGYNSGTCHALTSPKTIAFSLDVTNNSSVRTGYMRVYTTKDLCVNDTTFKNKNGKAGQKAFTYSYSTSNKSERKYIHAATVQYKSKYVITNSQGFTVIDMSLNGRTIESMTRAIGTQTVSGCKDYALSYGAYILGIDPALKYLPGGSKQSFKCPGSEKYGIPHGVKYCSKEIYSKSRRDLYSKIITKIDQGIPVIIHGHGASEHWVTVIGYKASSATSVNDDSTFRKNVWIIDPNAASYAAETRCRRKTGTLWQGPAINRSTYTTVYYSRAATWNSRTSACK